MLSFFLFVLLGAFFFTAIFGLLSSDSLTITYENHDLRLGKTPVVLIREILSAHWIFIVIGGLFALVASMFLTHRFAGPIYRLELSLMEMKKRNLDFEVRLRKKDEAKELAALLNEFNATLSKDLTDIRDATEALERSLSEAGRSAGAEACKGIDDSLAAVMKIRQVISTYRLKNDG